jgi:NADH-quinone oxidoreductase subunit C
MEREEVKRRLAEKFGAKVKIAERSPTRVYVYAENEVWVDLARFVFDDLDARFDTGVAVDNRDGVEVMFFFPFDREHFYLTVKTFAAKPNPTLDSISPVCPGAKWIEREMWEMYEVTFRNHPDLRPVLRADTRPADYYPAKREVKETHETVRQRDDGDWRADDVAGKSPRGKNP